MDIKLIPTAWILWVNAPMNTGLQISFWDQISIILDKYPGMGLLDHMTALFVIFLGTSTLFFTMAGSFYIATNGVQGLWLLHFLTDTCYLLFDKAVLTGVWSDTSLWFWFAFSWWLVLLSFHVPVGYLCPLGNGYSVSLPIFKLINSFFLCYWVKGIPYLPSILMPYQISYLQMFSQFNWMRCCLFSADFHSFDSCFLCRYTFLVWRSPYYLFLLLLPVLLVSYPRHNCQYQSFKVFFMFSSRDFVDSGCMFKSLIHCGFIFCV